jgi:hypothetical protein
MPSKARRHLAWRIFFFLYPLSAAPAFATQGHGGPEGLYVHQFAHLFFIFSMGLFIYWLRKRKLVHDPGWRAIQYSALFFILWNIDAFAVHWIEEQVVAIQIARSDTWHIAFTAPSHLAWIRDIYPLVKLDHLLCVPAMIFLYTGLRHLLGVSGAPPTEKGST